MQDPALSAARAEDGDPVVRHLAPISRRRLTYLAQLAQFERLPPELVSHCLAALWTRPRGPTDIEVEILAAWCYARALAALARTSRALHVAAQERLDAIFIVDHSTQETFEARYGRGGSRTAGGTPILRQLVIDAFDDDGDAADTFRLFHRPTHALDLLITVEHVPVAFQHASELLCQFGNETAFLAPRACHLAIEFWREDAWPYSSVNPVSDIRCRHSLRTLAVGAGASVSTRYTMLARFLKHLDALVSLRLDGFFTFQVAELLGQSCRQVLPGLRHLELRALASVHIASPDAAQGLALRRPGVTHIVLPIQPRSSVPANLAIISSLEASLATCDSEPVRLRLIEVDFSPDEHREWTSPASEPVRRRFERLGITVSALVPSEQT